MINKYKLCFFTNLCKILIIFIYLILCFKIFFNRPPILHSKYLNQGKYFSERCLLAPAFGKISRILKYNNGNILISIFLNLLDIHSQYYPIDGTILDQIYDNSGIYHIASDANKSDQNEKVITLMKDKYNNNITITQISGILIRRIYTIKKVGEIVSQGEYLGYITFGSRCDILIPPKYNLLPNICVDAHLDGPNTMIAYLSK
jgi:phosphatidylserine decarboxylase